MATIVVDDDRRTFDESFVEGLWGTVAEQSDEAFYDDRADADDDLEKGRIKFPAGRLYGRDDDLDALRGLYGEVANAADSRVVFLGGYSGVGKSAVVAELAQRLEEERGTGNVFCARGKYSTLQSATAPFSAIAESLGQLTAELTKSGQDELLENVRQKLCESADGNTEKVMSIMFPPIGPLFTTEEKSPKGESVAPNMNEVKQAFKDCMNCICSCLESPLIWFVDDCQWSDEASISLLKDVLSSEELSNVLFVGSYRSNDVNEEHPFKKLMNDVEKSNSCATSGIVLYGLSPDDIGEFISDTLGKDGAPEVSELTEAVYAKTLGNIFFVKQALEELVRKNALFYDVMMFTWEYNLTKVELENYLSDDVIKLVQSKIEGQPQEVKKLVVVMSLIPSNANLSTMIALLGCEGVDPSKVQKLLRYSVKQGLIIYQMESDRYAFAHDKIREASFTLISKGRPRDGLLVRISKVLIDLADSESENEWALFVAVEHMNSVVYSFVHPLKLSRLNLRVGEMNLTKGATFRANASFRSSLSYLILSGLKWREYQFTLQLLNRVIESEFSAGNFAETFSHVEDVLENATSLDDKFTAYLYKMKTFAEGENRDYAIGVVEGLKICELYGIKFPNPPKKSDLMKESLQLKAALRNRPLTVLSNLPRAEDPRMFILFNDLIAYANLSGNEDLVAIIVDRSIQLALQKGISKELMSILTSRAASLAKDLSKLKTANKLAVAADQISQIFREDDEGLYAGTQSRLIVMVFASLRSCRECRDVALNSYKPLLDSGRTYSALGSAMAYSYMYILAGLPLKSPLFEPKLIVFGEASRRLQMPSFKMVFDAFRQMLLNLGEESEDCTALKGEAFDEDAFLRSVDGNARSMALRDTSMIRLILAFVFCNEGCMVKMLEILTKFTDPDLAVPRSHLRLCFIGLAGLQMGQRKLANKCLEYFKSLSHLGSANATPIYHFMKASANPSREKYDEAISSCKKEKLVHLMAMANERCGMYLSHLGDDSSREYFVESYWLYQDWGASSKANDMLRQHPFLHQATKEYSKGPSDARSNMRLANKTQVD